MLNFLYGTDTQEQEIVVNNKNSVGFTEEADYLQVKRQEAIQKLGSSWVLADKSTYQGNWLR